jgi:hypothetical protein
MKTVIFPSEFAYEAKLPYDDKTKAQIKIARKWAKKFGIYLKLRGSGPRAIHSRRDFSGKGIEHGYKPYSRGYDQSLPLPLATYVRIYLVGKDGRLLP